MEKPKYKIGDILIIKTSIRQWKIIAAEKKKNWLYYIDHDPFSKESGVEGYTSVSISEEYILYKL